MQIPLNRPTHEFYIKKWVSHTCQLMVEMTSAFFVQRNPLTVEAVQRIRSVVYNFVCGSPERTAQ